MLGLLVVQPLSGLEELGLNSICESAATFSARKKDQETYREGQRQSQKNPEEVCLLQSVGLPDSRASEAADLLVKVQVGSRVTPCPGPSPKAPATHPLSRRWLAKRSPARENLGTHGSGKGCVNPRLPPSCPRGKTSSSESDHEAPRSKPRQQ